MDKTKKRSESGITLLALLVTIIMLVILSAVVLQVVTGENGLIKLTGTAAEENNKVAYEEQLEQKVRTSIMTYALEGKEAGIADIVKDLKEETEWIKQAEANTETDILVTTIEGHVYQIYYNNIYGIVYTEYLGKEDGKEYPNIKVRYESGEKSIYIETISGNIKKIELIYKGEILGEGIENPNREEKINIGETGTGWYKIKVTTNEGKIRYSWVKAINITEELVAPEIEIEPEGEEKNGWYGADKKDLWIKISTTSSKAKEIHYVIAGGEEQVEEITSGVTEERSIRIKIDGSGIIRIVATIEDGNGNSSNYAIEDIKYDKEPPVIKEVQVVGTKGNEEWYTEDVEIKIITDEIKAIYYYKVTDKEGNIIKDKTKVGTTDTEIRLERDGEYKIEIELEDLAGNVSEPKEIIVKRDTEAPILQEAKADVVTITKNSFKLSASAGDSTSQIAYYEFYIDGRLVETSESPTYLVTGLQSGAEYQASVKVYDKAGLMTQSVNIPVTTATETSPGTGGSGGSIGGIVGFGTYTITYNANLPEGITCSGLPNSRKFAHGEQISLSNNIPRAGAAGYNFYAWSTDPEAEETLYFPGSKITGYGNITLYAIWTDKCTISFDSNGGGVEIASQAFSNGGEIVLPSQAGKYVINENATFLGWAYTSDNNYVYYTPGDIYNDYGYGSCTLYAVWDQGITINIDTHGGTYANTHDDKVPLKLTYANGLGVELPKYAGHHPNPNITHWKWAIGNAGTNPSISSYWEGTSGYKLTDTGANGKTLHAMWDMQVTYKHDENTTLKIGMLPYKESLTLAGRLSTNPDPNNCGVTLQDGWSTTYGDKKRGIKSISASAWVNGGTYATLYPCWDYGSYVRVTAYCAAHASDERILSQYLPYGTTALTTGSTLREC